MNKIFKITALSLIVTLSSVSCIKEAIPNSLVTESQLAESPAAIDALFGALPTSMVLPGTLTSGSVGCDFTYPSLMLAQDGLAGDFIVTSTDASSGYNWFKAYSACYALAPNYFGPALVWYNYYAFIKSANDVIKALDGVATTTTMPYLAGAKIYRAMLYLDMARLYDPFENEYTDVSSLVGLTVPIVTETTTEAEARNMPRVTRDELFAFIFADLDAAEAIYSTEGVSTPTNGLNPIPAVIEGIRARAYLWLAGFDSSYYAKAAQSARTAINESGCTIMTASEWSNPSTGFNTANGAWMWYLTQSSSQLGNYHNYISHLSAEASWGYGRLVGGYGMRNKDYDRLGDSDVRKAVVKAPGSSLSDYNGLTCVTEESDFSKIYDYAILKFRPLGGVTNDYTAGATDVPLMRVEEMYYIEAEATAHTDAAAGLALLESIMRYRDTAYSCDATSSEDVVEEIIFNKRIEFWGEGVIFSDLKRLRYGIANGYSGTNVCSEYTYNVNEIAPWWNMCIPEDEVIQNVGLTGKNNPDPMDILTPWSEF